MRLLDTSVSSFTITGNSIPDEYEPDLVSYSNETISKVEQNTFEDDLNDEKLMIQDEIFLLQKSY